MSARLIDAERLKFVINEVFPESESAYLSALIDMQPLVEPDISDLEYTLSAVMFSVDKFLEDKEILAAHPVTRAIAMREKILRELEELERKTKVWTR